MSQVRVYCLDRLLNKLAYRQLQRVLLPVKDTLRRQVSKDKCNHTYQSLFLSINASIFGAMGDKQTSQSPCIAINEGLFQQQIAFSLVSPKNVLASRFK